MLLYVQFYSRLLSWLKFGEVTKFLTVLAYQSSSCDDNWQSMVIYVKTVGNGVKLFPISHEVEPPLSMQSEMMTMISLNWKTYIVK